MYLQDAYESAFLEAVRRLEHAISLDAAAFRAAVTAARRSHTRALNQVALSVSYLYK